MSCFCWKHDILGSKTTGLLEPDVQASTSGFRRHNLILKYVEYDMKDVASEAGCKDFQEGLPSELPAKAISGRPAPADACGGRGAALAAQGSMLTAQGLCSP